MTVPAPNLGGIFARWVGSDRIAFLDASGGDLNAPESVTFGDLDDRCGRLSAGLFRRGLAAGDRVGILADNSADYAAAYFGIVRGGQVTVPLNTRQPADTLAWVAADAGLSLLIHDGANADKVPDGVDAVELGSPGWSELLAGAPDPVLDVGQESVAVQMYTSGSTGRPKGVLLTHGGQLFSIDQYLSGVMPMDPDERLLVSAPMYHKNAQMQLKMAVALGGSVVLLQALFDQARSLFGPGVVITNGYGTTEVVAVFGGHPDGLVRPDISVGHPLAAVETRLVDPSTGSGAEPHEATGWRQGELLVRSPGLMAGYHNLAEVTAERVTDGWYHTGDVMEADADGWHYFVGRVDDMFSCAGENVYPGDVEQMLERCPAVHQAAVVPVPDELKGSLPAAFVVRATGHEPSEQEIKEWSLANGPAYQHPRAVWFLDELPLAGTAKLDKAALADEAARRWQPRTPV